MSGDVSENDKKNMLSRINDTFTENYEKLGNLVKTNEGIVVKSIFVP